MYWKEIPVQVQAEDADGPVSRPLHDRFQQGVDAISMFDGSSGTDDYLMAWEWGAETEMDGTAKQAAAVIAERFNSGFPRTLRPAYGTCMPPAAATRARAPLTIGWNRILRRGRHAGNGRFLDHTGTIVAR